MHLRNIAVAIAITSFMFLVTSVAMADPVPANGQVPAIQLVNEFFHHEHGIIDDRDRDEAADHERFHELQQREHGIYHEEERLRDRDRRDDGAVFDLGEGFQIRIDDENR
jgi:hypothetical protein